MKQTNAIRMCLTAIWAYSVWDWRTILVFPLDLPVAIPWTENFSESSSSAIDAMSTSVMSVELDGDIAVSPISLRRLATYLIGDKQQLSNQWTWTFDRILINPSRNRRQKAITYRMASIHSCRSRSLSTWNVRSMTFAHWRPRIMNVNGFGRSTLIIWQPLTVKLFSCSAGFVPSGLDL